MFGKQFYPTPNATIYDMIRGLDLAGKNILDPSAGDGAILDVVQSMTKHSYQCNHTGLYAIEIDPNLRAILSEKGHKVIDTDFLQYNGHRYFDFILMNPPFADGVKHLLKAWDIANGATIFCLLNANSVRGYDNPSTNGHNDKARLHDIIRHYGVVNYIGQPFKSGARRTTGVEVALVTLTDTKTRESFRLNFDPELAGRNGYHIPDIKESELAPGDAFDSYEARFNVAVKAFKKMLEARQEVKFYLDGIEPEYKSKDLITEAIKKATPDQAYTEFLDMLTQSAWDNLFQKTKLASITTEKVRGEIEKQQATQGAMAFTATNMQDLFFTLQVNKQHIMTQCVLEAFDNMTKYYKDNREYIEGWATNSAYFVGKKFILPSIGSVWGDGIDYGSKDSIRDIERALCFLTGKKFENIDSVTEIYGRDSNFGMQMFSEFFKTQLFKKRTMHFWWLDEDLRRRFNAVVAKERWGWLPEQIKTGAYR